MAMNLDQSADKITPSSGTLTVAGAESISGQITSTVATGTAPFVVSSTTAVANLSIGGNAANATNVAITDDTTTNSDYYVTFVSAASGNTGMKTSSTKLKYHPSTGALTTSTIYIAP